MNIRLRHQLVGALVLLALAVIFIPEFLDGKKAIREDDAALIPVRPATQNAAVTLPEQPKVATSADSDQQAQQDAAVVSADATEAEVSTPAVSVVADDDNAANPPPQGFKDNAWVIQLGGFKNTANVRDLVSKLREAGYRSFTRPTQPKQGQITRVYVGPDLSKDALEKKLPALKTLTKLSGKIYPYDPTRQ